MWNVLIAIIAAASAEVAMQLIEQDRENDRQRAKARDDRRANSKLIDQNSAKCGGLSDKIDNLDKEYKKIMADLDDQDRKLNDFNKKASDLKLQRRDLDIERQRLISEAFSKDGAVNRAKFLKIEFRKLVPRFTSLLGRIVGVLGALVTAATLAQYAKEKLDKIRADREALENELNDAPNECSPSTTSSLDFKNLLDSLTSKSDGPTALSN